VVHVPAVSLTRRQPDESIAQTEDPGSLPGLNPVHGPGPEEVNVMGHLLAAHYPCRFLFANALSLLPLLSSFLDRLLAQVKLEDLVNGDNAVPTSDTHDVQDQAVLLARIRPGASANHLNVQRFGLGGPGHNDAVNGRLVKSFSKYSAVGNDFGLTRMQAT
jgi:hypothetical protein